MDATTFQPMSVRALLAGIVAPDAVPDVLVTMVRDDSRLVQTGEAFVALVGAKQSGHAFVVDALERGARVVVADGNGKDADQLCAIVQQKNAVFVAVPNARFALGVMLARLYGVVDRVRFLGVTGTNGKTTTTYLLEAILKAAGRSPGVFGTVEYRFAGQCEPAPLTTPGATLFHAWLARMVAAGVTDVVMEASSHALDQDRLAGCLFDVGALTNLTQDHLDFHGTMEAYFNAKARLFGDYLKPEGAGVVFIDTDEGKRMSQRVRGRVCKVATSPAYADQADLCVIRSELSNTGTRLVFATPQGQLQIQSSLVGQFNVSNIAMAVGMAYAHGLPLPAIAQGVASLQGVPGRLQLVPNDRQVLCVVDYAHTPDALERAIEVLRPITKGRLIVVFGCGGDRDATKRPLMGGAVARLADAAVVTSDNPRTEDPERILAMIVEGMGGAKLHRSDTGLGAGMFCVQPDRKAAIAMAVAMAGAGDSVLIAGKGHEDYQIIGTQKHHFDDREEAAAAFSNTRLT